jgi:transcription antitermination protein NusB
MGTRRRARVIAVQALYGWETSRAPLAEVLEFTWLDTGEREGPYMDFARLLVAGTLENIEAIDAMIGRHLENWEIKRVNRVDLAVLRMSVHCLLHLGDIPSNVTIDEAIDIVREFGADNSYRFVNGVLDGILKSINAKPDAAAEK